MKKILFLLLVFAVFVFNGCDNFLSETDFKEKLNDTITIAKSQDVKLKIASDREYYGIFLDKMEGDFTFKMKQTVTVRFQLDSACSFKRWMIADSVTGKEIEDAVKVIEEITETENGSEVHTIKFTFLKSLPNLQLKPVCFLKNDTTAPEFTAFEVYNLGTYDEENEENNVLVTDKVFEEWEFNTESTAENPDDFDTHHVNGLKLKFRVKEDGQYEDGYLKVTEKLIRDVNGNNVDIVNTCLMPMSQVGKENCRNLGGGNYEVETDYEFVTPFDGVIAVTFAPVDAAGNDAKQGRLTYYVIKDTKINSFEYTMQMNYDTWEFEETLAESGDLWYNRYSFYYYPDKLLLKSSDAYSIESAIENMTVSGEMSNFLLDTGSGGYATPEGFRALLNKYFLSSGDPVYDVWYKGEDSEHIKMDKLTPFVEMSDDGVNYKTAELFKDKIKIFDNYCDGENCAYTETDAYYVDVSDYKKNQNLYFRFTVKDSAENPGSFTWSNSNQHSSEIVRADKVLTNTGVKNFDEIEFNASVPKIYDIESKIDLKVTGTNACNIESAGFFYCLTYTDGSVSNIKYSLDDPSLTAFSYSGDNDGNYISPFDSMVIQYNQQQYTTAKGPEDYAFNSISIWNLSCYASIYYDDEYGASCYLNYSDISSEKNFDYSDIKVLALYEDEIKVYTINDGNGLCTLGFLYPGSGRIHGFTDNPVDWKIYVKYEGVVYTEGGFSENGNQMYISNIPASKLREGVTFNAYADCKMQGGQQRVIFTNKSYKDPDAGIDVEPPVFEGRLSGGGTSISEYYPHMHYPANIAIFTFRDQAFNKDDVINIDVYYTLTKDLSIGLSYSEIRQLNHIKLQSQPVRSGEELQKFTGYGYADVLFDYSFLDDKIYTIYFIVNDRVAGGNRLSDGTANTDEISNYPRLDTSDGNVLCLCWSLDNRFLMKPFSLEEDYYVQQACALEGISSSSDNIDLKSVYDYNDALTDFQCTYGSAEKNSVDLPNARYSNFIYYMPVCLYYYEDDEGVRFDLTKEEYFNRTEEGNYNIEITGLTECNVKNVITNEEEGVYQIFCDQSVLVEYLINDKLVSQDDGEYWEHHTSNDNKTFTQLTVANPGQTTVKGYKIPKVPAGKYGFIIFHFADGTSMNSGVIEG